MRVAALLAAILGAGPSAPHAAQDTPASPTPVVAERPAEVGAEPMAKGSVVVTFASPDERREEPLLVTLSPVGSDGPGRTVAERKTTLPPSPRTARVVFDAVARGRWLVAWSGPRVAAGSALVVVADGPADGGRHLLRLGRTVEGSVHDDLDTPLAGARVTLFERSRLERRDTFHAEVRTAPDGGFRIEGAPDEELLAWSASAAGCMEGTGLLGGETRLGVVLDRAQKISGRVVDTDGKPVPEARIEVRYRREGWSTTARERVVVGDEGAFAFDREAPLATVVELRAKGFRLAERKLDPLPKKGAARELSLGDVVLDRGRALRGRVTDAVSGAAMAGVALRARTTREERDRVVADEQETTSGEDGTFLLEGIGTDRPVRLEARAVGFAPKTLGVEAGTDDAEVELALGRGGRVEGRLCGRPFEVARSEIWQSAPDFAEMRGSARKPDAMGRFVFTGVEPGRRTFLRAFAFEDPADPTGGAYVTGGTKATVLVEEGRTVTVTLGCDGIPLAGTLLREGAPASGKVVVFNGPGKREADAMTDAGGAFSLNVPVPGAWSPWIDDPVGLAAKWTPVSCEVPLTGLSGCEVDLRPAEGREAK